MSQGYSHLLILWNQFQVIDEVVILPRLWKFSSDFKSKCLYAKFTEEPL